MSERFFELIAEFGTRAPFKILADGGVVLHLDLPEGALETVTRLYRNGKGKNLKVLIEITEPQTYGQKQLEGQTSWVPDETV